MKRNKSLKRLVVISLLGTISGILMVLEFPIPWLAPDFYGVDFSEVPVLVGAFSYGPVAGIIIEGLKIIVKLAIKPTSTFLVGELANFLVGLAFVVPASIIYAQKKTKKRAIIGLAVGGLTMAIVAALLNAFVLLPVFALMMGAHVDDFVALGNMIFPFITNVFTFMVFSVVPFNLVKATLVSVIVVIIYKRISPLIKAEDSDDFEEVS
ncbi:MAG: ECF transporter S component [Candidatus Izimaplasma sp.]|nr:ECF transporter S component [Candidatus Izimaplasma bacterium]